MLAISPATTDLVEHNVLMEHNVGCAARFSLTRCCTAESSTTEAFWEVANRLRLPRRGPYVVIAAELPAVGTEALPDIESKLAGLDVHSAWRLLPDVQIGIAHVRSDHEFDGVVALVCCMAADRVGVSARFHDLRTRHTPCTAPR
jgi:hypothetical protein